jgi:hypothetical protein
VKGFKILIFSSCVLQASEQSKAPVSAKTGKPRNQSIIMDVDMRDDSSDDGEDEVTTNDSHANSNHAIKNTVSETHCCVYLLC